jgi:hypothetical protein
MVEIILNHIKSYYHGVKGFKCRSLREELGNKINVFKQRMKSSNRYPKKNYFEENLTDDENENDEKDLFKLKRKRNDDDEKENHRKVIIKSTVQRTVIIKKSNENNETQNEIIEKFDHEYCDIMYDNEFEGLHLSHFSPCDIELNEDIPVVDIKPSGNILSLVNHSSPLPTSNNEAGSSSSFILYFINCIFIDYIILSSDDEDQTTESLRALSTTTILPIYLLNRLSE